MKTLMKHHLNEIRGVTIAAVLFFSLIAGCGGNTSTDGTVTASAGDDQKVTIGTEVSLDGLASIGVTSASWTFVSKPSGSAATISGADTLSATFTADVVGTYEVQLSINGGASIDTVIITANTVTAGISVPASSAVTTRERFGTTEYVIDLQEDSGVLSAESSTVVSGATIASYSWEQVAGPAVTVSGEATGSTFTFTTPGMEGLHNQSDHYRWQVLPISRDDTKMIFKLTVTDSDGNSDVTTFTAYVTDNGAEIHTQAGLPNVAVGAKTYLSGPDVSKGNNGTTSFQQDGSTAYHVTDWSWTLSVPSGSTATFADSGTTTSTSQFPSFTPDVAGVYTISYTSNSANSTAITSTLAGASNIAPGSFTVNAADWTGVGTIVGSSPTNPECATCHGETDVSGSGDKVSAWQETRHSTIFQSSMSAYAGLAPDPYLWQYHTVGYNTDADNSGFDDLAADDSFTFPEDGMAYADFLSQYPTVAKLANVQCENCHGPGSQHQGDPLRISKSSSQAGTCGQCHIEESQWKNGAHNSTSSYATGAWLTNVVCARCHATAGFIEYLDGGASAVTAATDDTVPYGNVNCVACHNPHDATNSYQLRAEGTVTMLSDVSYNPNKVVNAGKAAICYQCHIGNREFGQLDCYASSEAGTSGIPDTLCSSWDYTAIAYAGGAYHDTAQSSLLEGNQALADLDGDGTDDISFTENSFHTSDEFILSSVTGDSTLSSTNNKCVTCHMATPPSPDEEGYQALGGHSFALVSGETELVSACQTCHGDKLTEFNRLARADYDGDGSIEGIQDEIKGLLVAITTKVLSYDDATNYLNHSSGTTAASDGTITTGTINYNGTTSTMPVSGKDCSTPASSTWKPLYVSSSSTGYRTCNFLATDPIIRRALWNINSIVKDGSYGIHNAAYEVQILQGTYRALGILLDGEASTYSYQTDYPNAAIR